MKLSYYIFALSFFNQITDHCTIVADGATAIQIGSFTHYCPISCSLCLITVRLLARTLSFLSISSVDTLKSVWLCVCVELCMLACAYMSETWDHYDVEKLAD